MKDFFDPIKREAQLAKAHATLDLLEVQIEVLEELNAKWGTDVELSDVRQQAERLRRLIAEIEQHSGLTTVH